MDERTFGPTIFNRDAASESVSPSMCESKWLIAESDDMEAKARRTDSDDPFVPLGGASPICSANGYCGLLDPCPREENGTLTWI
jgi:hypothetical protein